MSGSASRAKNSKPIHSGPRWQARGSSGGAAPQRRQVAEGIEQRAQGWLLAAEVEDQHEHHAGDRVVEVHKGEQQRAAQEERPVVLLEAPHCQQRNEQCEEDIEVQQIAQEVIGIEGENPERLGKERKHPQPGKIAADVMGVEQTHRHTVAEEREGHASDPAEHRILREKDRSHMVYRHGQHRDELEKIGIQIGSELGVGFSAVSIIEILLVSMGKLAK